MAVADGSWSDLNIWPHISSARGIVLLYFTSLKRILRLLAFHGIVLVTLQLLLSSPLINIWSPDCLLPVLGGCDGHWAGWGLGWLVAGLGWLGWAGCGLGSTLCHPNILSSSSVAQCSAVQCSAADIAHLTSCWRPRDPPPPSRCSLPRTALVHMVSRDKSVTSSSSVFLFPSSRMSSWWPGVQQ